MQRTPDCYPGLPTDILIVFPSPVPSVSLL